MNPKIKQRALWVAMTSSWTAWRAEVMSIHAEAFKWHVLRKVGLYIAPRKTQSAKAR